MDLRIQVKDDNGNQVQRLYRWLGRDARFARQATIRPVPGATTSGQMSAGALELINLILSNSIALSSLVTSIMAFCRSARNPAQPEPVVVVLRDGRPPVQVTGSSDMTLLVAALGDELGRDTAAKSRSADEHTG